MKMKDPQARYPIRMVYSGTHTIQELCELILTIRTLALGDQMILRPFALFVVTFQL